MTGIDFSEVGLAKLRRLASARHLSIRTIHEDLCTYAITENYFDLITADTVLGHLSVIALPAHASNFNQH